MLLSQSKCIFPFLEATKSNESKCLAEFNVSVKLLKALCDLLNLTDAFLLKTASVWCFFLMSYKILHMTFQSLSDTKKRRKWLICLDLQG